MEGLHLLRELRFKPTATLVGPGLGSEGETIAMITEALKDWNSPLVLDADALRPEILNVVSASFIATPHLGEFRRLLGTGIEGGDIDGQLRDYAREHGGVVVLKGPNTRIVAGDCLFVNTTGNSILARGGSGDLLAGGWAPGIIAGRTGRGCLPSGLLARKGSGCVSGKFGTSCSSDDGFIGHIRKSADDTFS